MILDWLKLEPQNGQAGTTGIMISTLSVNEGIDREKTVHAVCGNASVSMTVRQSGLREVFNAADGNFILSDGETFNVLKNEQQI
nr:hypothetical protein [uncultured Bacteroides sp.]